MQLLTSATYFNSAAISIDLEIAFTVAIESIDQQVAPIDPALKPGPTHCLIKLGRVRPLIEGIALSRVTLVRSFWVTRKVKVI